MPFTYDDGPKLGNLLHQHRQPGLDGAQFLLRVDILLLTIAAQVIHMSSFVV